MDQIRCCEDRNVCSQLPKTLKCSDSRIENKPWSMKEECSASRFVHRHKCTMPWESHSHQAPPPMLQVHWTRGCNSLSCLQRTQDLHLPTLRCSDTPYV